MLEFFTRLFDPTGFTPRRHCGNWSDELAWLHIGSDLFIWLAYISIPLMLIWFSRRWTVMPLRWLGLFFAGFILSCGFTHFIEAMIFFYPVYRLSGLMKLITALLSWATVVALFPLMPRVIELLQTEPAPPMVAETPRTTWSNYGIAILAALAALVLRGILSPFLETQHVFVFALLAVMVVGWLAGFGPALVTLVLCFLGTTYLIIEPRGSIILHRLPDQLGMALFFFGGFGSAVLAASARLNRLRVNAALAEAIRQRDALATETGLRREIQAQVAQRTEELADAQRQTAGALARYRTLTEAVPQVVWTADPTGTVNYFNRRWDEYTGIRDSEGTGFCPDGLIHPDDLETLKLAWADAVQTQADSFALEFRLRRQDGLYLWHLSSALSIKNEDGQITEWVGTLTNIQHQKSQAEELSRLVDERTHELKQQVEERTQAEARTHALAEELQRSNRELEAFASVASHDLQEPLRKIQAFGDRLGREQRENLTESGKEQLDRILNAATRMRRLIEDLLTYSRVTTRAKPFTEVDLNRTLRDVLSDLEVRIAQSHAEVTVEPLPTLQADPTQMHQLFQNLVGNAVKFTPHGQPPRVHISTEAAEPGYVRLIVQDEGIGFEPRYLDRIFQVFQRLHGRTEYEGTGIGLAICKKIVDRHGGNITAQSEAGQGATFVVDLPLVQMKVEETES